jgi:hypothetical protein
MGLAISWTGAKFVEAAKRTSVVLSETGLLLLIQFFARLQLLLVAVLDQVKVSANAGEQAKSRAATLAAELRIKGWLINELRVTLTPFSCLCDDARGVYWQPERWQEK